MTRWEYSEYRISQSPNIQGTGVDRNAFWHKPDGSRQELDGGKPFLVQLTEFGAEGWEVIQTENPKTDRGRLGDGFSSDLHKNSLMVR